MEVELTAAQFVRASLIVANAELPREAGKASVMIHLYEKMMLTDEERAAIGYQDLGGQVRWTNVAESLNRILTGDEARLLGNLLRNPPAGMAWKVADYKMLNELLRAIGQEPIA